MVYHAVKHVNMDQIWTALLSETIARPVNKFYKAAKATKALGKRLLRNVDFHALIALFVHMKTMD